MNWSQIGVIAGVLLPVTGIILNGLGILGKIFSFFSSVWGKLFGSRQPSEPTNHNIPIKTVVVIQQSRPNALWWSKGAFQNKPIMQVVGDFDLTNTWSKDIKLAGAMLRYKRWFFFSREVRGDASVKDIHSQYSGDYPVPHNEMTWLRVSFVFAPQSKFPAKDFIADMAVIDQFNNYHWLKNLCFKHPDAMPF